MTQVLRSFRIFGNFSFGRSDDSAKSKPVYGNCLDIFHVSLGEDKEDERRYSLARVSKVKGASSIPARITKDKLPDPAHNVFLDNALKQIASDLAKEDEVIFWIHKPKAGGQGGRRLFLFGPLWLDQFAPDEDETPTERFPLVPEMTDNGKSHVAKITFGNGDTFFDLRLELGFPMPVPVGSRAEYADSRGGALGLHAVFPTTRRNPDHLRRPTNLLVGPPGDGAHHVAQNWIFGEYAVGIHDYPAPFLVTGSDRKSGPQMQTLLGAMGFPGQKDYADDHVLEFKSGKHPKDKEHHVYVAACRRPLDLRDVDTVKLTDDNARLDLTEQLGGMLELVGRSVTLECHWIVTLSDEILLDALGDGSKLPEVAFQASLRFDVWTSLTNGVLGETGEHPPDNGVPLILRGAALEEAARLSNAARASLVATDRQPQSILPRLQRAGNSTGIDIRIIAYPRDLAVTYRVGRLSTLSPAAESRPPVANLAITPDTEWLAPRLKKDAKEADEQSKIEIGRKLNVRYLPGGEKAWPQAKHWLLPPSVAAPMEWRILLPGFDDRVLDPREDADHNHVLLGYDPRVANIASTESGVFVAIANDRASAEQGHDHGLAHYAGLETRLGSLAFRRDDLLLAADEPGTISNASRLVIRRRHRTTAYERNAAAPMATLDVEWTLALALDEAYPVTTDIPHGVREERPADLLIRETPLVVSDDIGSDAVFRLTVIERLRDDQDRRLTAELFETESQSPDARATFTVLTAAPFSAYRFSRRPLGAGGDTDPVASFDSDTREWRLLRAGETYRFTRPAGAVGEDADKPGRLELHDPEKRAKDLPPAIKDSEAGVPRRHALDMRLSPPTDLWIDPSDLRRNFLLPEYAAREVFRQRGDFGLGVQLNALRGELLYGLAFSVLVPKAEDTARPPRVAELQTLTGRMIEANPKTDNSILEERWKVLRHGFRQRSERLEVWTLDARRKNPFVPAKFSEGTKFALRHTALLAPPVVTGNYTPEIEKDAPLQAPRFHDHGLSGGALWPLESANVTRVLAGNPAATGGEVEGLVLSPLGDSGNQTARFLNGYATIITETRDGFLHKHRIEILGRIAGLWPRAKHVVVYERTTSPSPQFAPFPIQKSRTSRPVLRKVEEFVEIQEPLRRYPDMPDVAPRTCGCLEGVRFNSTIIHVNSAWGRDVGEDGWEVPLWNRGEAELRPQVYPYPDVAFVTTGEGGGAAPKATQECLDVANLYFYTDPVAAQKTSNTDLWPVRYGVDTCGMGHPNDLLRELLGIKATAETADEDKAALAGRRPAASRIVPGLRRFTWRLAPSPIRSRINAERGQKPIFSGLSSVTLMRSPGGATDHAQRIKDALDIKRTSADTLSNLVPSNIPLPQTLDNATLGNMYEAAAEALENLSDDPSQDELRKFRDTLQQLTVGDAVKEFDLALGGGNSIIKTVRGIVGNVPEVYGAARNFDIDDCEALAARATGAVRQRKLLCLQMVRQAKTEFVATVRSLKTITPEEAKIKLSELIDDATRDLFDQANRDLGDLGAGIATARAIVSDWRSDVHVAMDQARARIAAFRTGYDANKPWSRNRIDKAFVALRRELDALEREATAALEEARTRMATEIDSSARSLGARVTMLIERALKAERSALDGLDGIGDAINASKRQVLDVVDRLPNIGAKLDQMDTKVDDLDDGDIKDRAKATMSTLRGVFDDVEVDKKKQATRDAVTGLKIDANNALQDIKSAATRASNTAEHALQDIRGVSNEAHAAAGEFVDDTTAELKELAEALGDELSTAIDDVEAIVEAQLRVWADETRMLDKAVADAEAWIISTTAMVDRASNHGLDAVDEWLGVFKKRLDEASDILNTQLKRHFDAHVVTPVIDTLFDAADWPDEDGLIKARAIELVETLAEDFELALDAFTELPLSQIEQAKQACVAVVGFKTQLHKELDEIREQVSAELKAVFGPVLADIEQVLSGAANWTDKAEDILKGTDKLLDTATEIGNQIAEVGENARAYIDRGAEILSRAADAKPAELPGLALQFVSAATQAPEIAALRANADRIRVLLDDAKDVLETPVIRGALDQLGDALKALGLDFNFREFGDQFVPDFSDIDGDKLLRDLIPDLGAINLKDMLPRAALPGGVTEAVKVTHDLDAKVGRAWVQADVNVTLPAREPMFTIGPFTLFLKDTLLTAFIRAEASKDQSEVALSDQALLLTTIEAVVAGQVMVTLQDVAIRYSSKDQLDFTLDPSKIRIHQTMRFIQDTLGSIFGDELGGLQFIKENGIPVGVEHKFAIPPLSLMYGTSGVSNLQISNRFSLRAYPDFIIANRFNLSRRELPFLFSVFIIGGTGYIQVDTDYRPFDKRLMVVVEAGVGGSAALGFAFGPVSGGVFISLSVALRYQKTIGDGPKGEDGLSISLVLVIAGTVSLWGIVSVYLGLMLSIQYHESGRMDGLGQLMVEVRISRWFKLRYSTQVKYKLRDGRSSTQVTTETTTGGKYKDALKKYEALKRARESL